MKSKKSKKKKKIITICLTVILIVLVIIGLSILSILTPHELNTIGLNTIYTNEIAENEEENKFLILDPNENNEEPSEPGEEIEPGKENNENNQNNKSKPDKPKVVDSPYYIKVNNQANVVTVYKKDTKRKLYSTSKSYDLLNRRCNTGIRSIYNFRQVYMEIARTEMFMDNMHLE